MKKILLICVSCVTTSIMSEFASSAVFLRDRLRNDDTRIDAYLPVVSGVDPSVVKSVAIGVANNVGFGNFYGGLLSLQLDNCIKNSSVKFGMHEFICVLGSDDVAGCLRTYFAGIKSVQGREWDADVGFSIVVAGIEGALSYLNRCDVAQSFDSFNSALAAATGGRLPKETKSIQIEAFDAAVSKYLSEQ
jgi:hypothetical protein